MKPVIPKCMGGKRWSRFDCLSKQSQEAGVQKRKWKVETNKNQCEINELTQNNNKVYR